MNLNDYLIDQSDLDWNDLLREWHWLLPDSLHPWMLTRAGDLIFVSSDGSIQLLDVGAGSLQQVANDRDDFCAKIDIAENAKSWLMISVVDALVAAGTHLASGKCYSYRTLPTLGGDYSATNRMVFPIVEHFGGWGSVQRQLADVPDGENVVIKVLPPSTLSQFGE